MRGGSDDPAVAATLTSVARATDAAEVVRLAAAGTRQVNERHATGIGILLDSAPADPSAAEQLQVSMRRFRDALDTIAGQLAELGPHEAADRDRTGDILWYLFGWVSWRILVVDLKWTWDEAEQWLTQRGIEALVTAP